MRKITEFLLSLFFSKEVIAQVRREAIEDSQKAVTEFENKKYLSNLKKGGRYKKVPSK